MSQVRVFTGPRRWTLQDAEGRVFYVDLWAIEAIAKTIRQIDNLGADLELVFNEKESAATKSKKREDSYSKNEEEQ